MGQGGSCLLPSLYPSSPVCSLCSEGLPTQTGKVTALHFAQTDELLLAGYRSGLLKLWQHNTVVGQKQVRTGIEAETVHRAQVGSCNHVVCLFVSVYQISDCPITAICSMPDNQLAVSYMKAAVDVFKLVWNHQHSTAR